MILPTILVLRTVSQKLINLYWFLILFCNKNLRMHMLHTCFSSIHLNKYCLVCFPWYCVAFAGLSIKHWASLRPRFIHYTKQLLFYNTLCIYSFLSLCLKCNSFKNVLFCYVLYNVMQMNLLDWWLNKLELWTTF